MTTKLFEKLRWGILSVGRIQLAFDLEIAGDLYINRGLVEIQSMYANIMSDVFKS